MRNRREISEQEYRRAVRDIAFRVSFADRLVSAVALAVLGSFAGFVLVALVLRWVLRFFSIH